MDRVAEWENWYFIGIIATVAARQKWPVNNTVDLFSITISQTPFAVGTFDISLFLSALDQHF